VTRELNLPTGYKKSGGKLKRGDQFLQRRRKKILRDNQKAEGVVDND